MLSSSRNADDEHLNHLRCKKGGDVNILTLIEPFELALGGRRLACYMYVNTCSELVYTTEHS